MIAAGLLQECRALARPRLWRRAAADAGDRLSPPDAVVDGQDTLENALVGMRRDTRHFARRQRTWFRGVPDAVWLKPDDSHAIESRVRAFLEQGDDGAR